jgi:hypothetical protein
VFSTETVYRQLKAGGKGRTVVAIRS